MITAVQKLLNQFNEAPNKENLELEMRFRFSKFRFAALYDIQELKTGECTKTIEQIRKKDDRTNVITQTQFPTGEKRVSTKRRISINPVTIFVHGNDKIKLSLSEENEFSGRVSAGRREDLIRLKYRVSKMLNTTTVKSSRRGGAARDAGQWRLDMTIVREIVDAEEMNRLPEIIKSLFTKPFEEHLKTDNDYRYEVEIEYISKTSNTNLLLTEDYLAAAADLIKVNKQVEKTDEYITCVAEIAAILFSDYKKLSFRNERTIKRLFPRPVSLDVVSYGAIYPPVGFYVTDKADGIHAFAYVKGKKCYLLCEEIEIFELAREFPTLLVEGEYLPDLHLLLLFDVLILDEEYVFEQEGKVRIPKLIPAAAALSEALQTSRKTQGFALNVRAKNFSLITRADPEFMKSIFDTHAGASLTPGETPLGGDYPRDGLILVETINKWQDTKTYKWKDVYHNTIDFYVHKSDNRDKQYTLYSYISRVMYENTGFLRSPNWVKLFPNSDPAYFPTEFMPSIMPGVCDWDGEGTTEDASGRTVELSFCDGKWIFHRFRTDKEASSTPANDFRVAELTFMNSICPLEYRHLYDGVDMQYFIATKSGIYQEQTAFANRVKERLISKHLKGAERVVDIGIGRGGDLARYARAGIKTLIGVDSDKPALLELITRKYNIARKIRVPKIFILHSDMTQEYGDLPHALSRLVTAGSAFHADSVVMNLCFHYFAETEANIYGIIHACREILQSGGTIIITAFDGAKIFALLEEQNSGIWRSEDGKYAINKHYKAPFGTCGQTIAVKHPFSVDKMYKEYLVNFEYLISISREMDFDVEFDSIFTDVGISQDKLSETDKKYLGLYRALVLRKN